MENYLEIKNLKVDYKTFDSEKNVLDIDHLEIKKGTTFGIVGESGAGKTVLALTILRLLATPPGVIRSGEILLNGEDVLKKSHREMEKIRGSKIAMIFQDPLSSLNPVFTVRQQLIDVVLAHNNLSKKQAGKVVLEMIRKVKLPDPESTLNKYPHELSGGQRQRIIIAMALLCGAEFLIADEPTRNLDVTIQAGILKLISDLQKEFNITVLYIANNLGLVSATCDEVAVLKDGKICEQGSAKTLIDDAKHEYTRKLISVITPENKTQSEDCNYDENEKILVVENLKKYFPVKNEFQTKKNLTVKAVDNVSFTISRKETVGIVGESGCGKSTLVNTIMLLHKPTGGKVEMFGQNIGELKRSELQEIRKQVQIVFQDPYWSLNPRWMVKDIIGEPIKVHEKMSTNEYLKTVQDLAEMVGLTREDVFKFPHEFSGGQRQRIAIARALSVKPKLIILDEPTSAIDVVSQSQILKLLEDLRHSMNLSYILISHDLSVVNNMSDNIMVMYLGKIVEYGKAQTIFNDPKHPYTKALFNAIPNMHTRSVDELAIIKGEVPSAINPPTGCRFHPRCEYCTERCKQEEPEMKEVSGRLVQCFLYD